MELHDFAQPESPSDSWVRGQPVVIDLGSYHTRVGMAGAAPAHCFPSFSAKSRSRGANAMQRVVGVEAVENNARSTLKPVYDSGTVANWDAVEHVLDYSFELLGVNSDGFVDSPLVLSEQMAAPHSGRANFAEILFEGYGIPQLKTCVDAAAAYSHSAGLAGISSGYGVHLGNEAVHITPYLDGTPDFSGARRLNWGGRQAGEFMQKLLALKYPAFPVRLSGSQSSQIFERCCYVAQDYATELANFLTIPGLEAREKIVQLPPPAGRQEPSPEQLEAQAARRRESGRRLQEQAQKARQDKLRRLEQELSALQDMQSEGTWEDQFSSEEAFIAAMARVRRAINPDDVDEEAPPKTPLLSVPDADLDPEQVKEKRKQKLLKANYDSRMKLKAEKLAKSQESERLKKEDEEWRQRDLEDWIKTKRQQLFELRDTLKERHRIREQLNDRRSMASKMRMKSIVLLASGEGQKKRKLKDQDDFGANDDDWQVYNDAMVKNDDEDEEEKIQLLQAELLEHDPSFSLEEMHERIDWKQSTIHKFLYGAHSFDPESPQQTHQLNINLERIRVPEVLFQPMINGIDQAGITEILSNVIKNNQAQIKDVKIALTGGLAQLPGLGSRIQGDLQALLPWQTPISIHNGDNPMLDAWRGMSANASVQQGFLTKQEYDESGYIVTRHPLGNIY